MTKMTAIMNDLPEIKLQISNSFILIHVNLHIIIKCTKVAIGYVHRLQGFSHSTTTGDTGAYQDLEHLGFWVKSVLNATLVYRVNPGYNYI